MSNNKRIPTTVYVDLTSEYDLKCGDVVNFIKRTATSSELGTISDVLSVNLNLPSETLYDHYKLEVISRLYKNLTLEQLTHLEKELMKDKKYIL